jgi:hypothetical protein
VPLAHFCHTAFCSKLCTCCLLLQSLLKINREAVQPAVEPSQKPAPPSQASSTPNPVNPPGSSSDDAAATKAPDPNVPFSSSTAAATPSQSASGKALSAGVIVGICMGLAGVMLCIGAAILLPLRRRRRGSGAPSAKPAHSSGTERDTESLKELHTGHHEGPGLAIGPSKLPRNAPPAHLPLAIHDPPYQQARADPVLPPPPPGLQDRARPQRAHRDIASEATSASADVLSASTSSAAPTLSVTTYSATASGAKPAWAAGIATRTHDTFFDMTQQSRALEPPVPGAGAEERQQFLHHQLDSLVGREVLQGLLLLQGSNNRLQGGNVFGPDLVGTCLSSAFAAQFAQGFACGGTCLF